MKTPKRLIDTGGYEKKDRITHRIPISKLSEVDDEVKLWLRKVYERRAMRRGQNRRVLSGRDQATEFAPKLRSAPDSHGVAGRPNSPPPELLST